MSHLLSDHPDWPNAAMSETPSYPQGDAALYWKGRAETAERDLAARKAELTEANRLVAFWQQSSAEWKASRERLDAELARVLEELASVNRAYAAVMQAVDECGSYKP